MYRVTRTHSRPSTNVEFWSEDHPLVSAEIKEYRHQNYTLTGKFVSRTISLSQDGLNRTVVATWQNKEALDEFLNDPRIVAEFENPGQQYMTENGIVRVSAISEEI